MKNFELVLPKKLADAVDALPDTPTRPANEEPVRILAGGQDLLPELKDRLTEPATVVDIKGVAELDRGIEVGDGRARIGALATVAQVAASDELRAAYPALAEAAASIASPQIRSQATVAGNLCQRPRCWYYRNEETVCLKKGGDECFSWAGLNKYTDRNIYSPLSIAWFSIQYYSPFFHAAILEKFLCFSKRITDRNLSCSTSPL